MPFSNCSQYPVVSRNSANGIKNYNFLYFCINFKNVIGQKFNKAFQRLSSS